MSLDPAICSRARLARDPRFDGKFFIGVITTKIYCRPICRARVSKEENVRYFPTAAAAAEAGFRPCLRCRPECSPGTPVWAGTRNTVSRALQLITEDGLKGGGIERLAERVGVGSRHLRRLFLQHVGATPSSVTQSLRLHFAKKLIDETRLPMDQVALVSGFGSVRRFNVAIKDVYHRTPTQIRQFAPRVAALAENNFVFQLSFRPPYNWRRMLEFLAAHATPGVEVVDPDRYRRSISLQGTDGCFEVALKENSSAVSVRIQFADPCSLFLIVERIRAMFDLNADWEVIARALRGDLSLRPLVRAEAGLRVPGCWSGFELAVRAILEGQTGASAASALAGRLTEVLGRPFSLAPGISRVFPTADALAEADLVALGLPRGKEETIRALARAVRNQQIKFEGIVDCETFVARLLELPGFTKWAAGYVAMRALRDPDAFPTDDLVLRHRAGDCTLAELERRSEMWRPWRAYAATLLWQTAHFTTASGSPRYSGVRGAGVRAAKPPQRARVRRRANKRC